MDAKQNTANVQVGGLLVNELDMSATGRQVVFSNDGLARGERHVG